MNSLEPMSLTIGVIVGFIVCFVFFYVLGRSKWFEV